MRTFLILLSFLPALALDAAFNLAHGGETAATAKPGLSAVPGVLTQFMPYAEPAPANWAQANRKVGQVGGWAGYSREEGADGAESGSGKDNPHQHHQHHQNHKNNQSHQNHQNHQNHQHHPHHGGAVKKGEGK